MPETIQEYVNSANQQLRIDRGTGVLRGVKLLGFTSRNGRRYLESALREAALLYEGSKVNVNHPKGSPLAPRDYQDRIGVIRKVEFRPQAGLFGELHYNPKHPLAEQLLWDAQHQPASVGLSHNVLARTSHKGKQTVVEAIDQVHSVDLVADPATTRGLFEQSGQQQDHLDIRWDALTLEHLELHRPDLVQELRQDLVGEVQDFHQRLKEAQLRESKAQRARQIIELLSEHRLPLPSESDERSRALVDDSFMAELMEAADEQTVSKLIAKRACLIHQARTLPAEYLTESRPRSRDQGQVSGSRRPAVDASQFAAAITA